jgi:uncharacterized protein
MMARITPMLEMFARSPIRPIQAHMRTATTCVEGLCTFIDAVLVQDWAAAQVQQAQISHLEREADDLKKDLRAHLPKGLFMAISRGDILSLLSVQDKMANRAKDVAGVMLGRRMVIPASMVDTFKAYVERSVDAAKQAQAAISELDDLMEQGFRGQEVSLVEDMIHQIDDIERDTDDQQVVLREQLFALEKDMAPVDVMFLYRVLELVGKVADRAQEVGGRLQLLLAR